MPTKEEANKRMMKETYRKREVLKNSPITVEQYQDWKAQGHTDVYIMEQVEMHNAAFNEWKRAAGLIGKKKEEPKEKEPIVYKAEIAKPFEVAESQEESTEIQELKYQIKQLEIDHAETLSDYSMLQKKHEDVLKEMKFQSEKHNNELVMHGKVGDNYEELYRRFADMELENEILTDSNEKLIKELNEQEKLSLLLAKQFISNSVIDF